MKNKIILKVTSTGSVVNTQFTQAGYHSAEMVVVKYLAVMRPRNSQFYKQSGEFVVATMTQAATHQHPRLHFNILHFSAVDYSVVSISDCEPQCQFVRPRVLRARGKEGPYCMESCQIPLPPGKLQQSCSQSQSVYPAPTSSPSSTRSYIHPQRPLDDLLSLSEQHNSALCIHQYPAQRGFSHPRSSMRIRTAELLMTTGRKIFKEVSD